MKLKLKLQLIFFILSVGLATFIFFTTGNAEKDTDMKQSCSNNNGGQPAPWCKPNPTPEELVEFDQKTLEYAKEGWPVYQYIHSLTLFNKGEYVDAYIWMKVSADFGFDPAINILPKFDVLFVNNPSGKEAANAAAVELKASIENQ